MVRYFLEVNLVWAVFLLVYTVFLRRETYFHINRWYLLASLVAGLLLPLIPWPAIWPATTEEVLMPIYIVEPGDYVLKLEEPTPVFDWQRLLLIAYTLFVCFGIGRLGVGCWKLWKWFQQAERIVHPAFVMVLTSFYHLPFSFFHFLYRSKLQHLTPQEEQMMIWHEEAHIQNRHSLDRLLAEVVTTVFWLSPLPYVYRYLIILNHEYEADAAVLAKTSRKQYGQLLLQQSLSGPAPALVHSFFQLPIKNRIRMMLQHPSTRKARLKLLLALPLLAGLALAFAPRKATKNDLVNAKSSFKISTDSVPNKTLELPPSELKKVLNENDPIFEGNDKILYLLSDDRMGSVDKLTPEMLNGIKVTMGPEAYKKEYPESSYTPGLVVVAFDIVSEKAHNPISEKNNGTIEIGSTAALSDALLIVDDEVRSQEDVSKLDITRIKAVNVFKGEKAIEKYGEKAKNGVVVITTNKTEKRYITLDGTEYTGSIDEIDPGSISKINVLKGQASIVKYGEKAKEGALEIFTKNNPDSNKQEVYKVADDMPRFPGCEDEKDEDKKLQCAQTALFTYLANNLVYPKSAIVQNLEGMVVASFVVRKDGSLDNISIAKSLNPDFDAEVIRVIKSMPNWIPSPQADIEMKLPVRFKKPDTQSTDTETTTKTPDNILEISNYRANLSTRGKLDLSFSATKGNTEVLVSTLDGKAIFQKTYKGFNGQFRESITLPSNLAANAVLVVSVRQGSKQNTRKVVVP